MRTVSWESGIQGDCERAVWGVNNDSDMFIRVSRDRMGVEGGLNAILVGFKCL